MKTNKIKQYEALLRKELVPALGCTEPGAVGYAAAKAADVLGVFPEHIEMYCSANIIKNVKSVNVPNSNGMKGIEAAAVLGMLSGDPEDGLEIFKNATSKEIERTKELIASGFCKVHLQEGEGNLYINAEAFTGDDKASVIIKDTHTNIIYISKNDQVLFENKALEKKEDAHDFTTVAGIIEYADNEDLETLKDIIGIQITVNTAIAEEGLSANYGANVGKTLIEAYGNDIMAYEMAKRGQGFRPGDGIVSDDIEETIKNFGIVGREGMKETDVTIMNLMIGC